jgi:ELWxxDGT repeat protein
MGRMSAAVGRLILAGLVLVSPAAGQAPELVKDLCDAVTRDSSPEFAKVLGDRLVFLATGSTVPGIWASDGTAPGTRPVRDLPCFRFFDIGVIGSAWHFAAYCSPLELQLWQTDGTWPGTRTYATIPFRESSSLVLAGGIAGGRSYVLIDESLWVSDGSAAGTRPVAAMTGQSLPQGSAFLVAAGDRVYFPWADAAHGLELWSSDGTAAGTGMVRDIYPGVEGSSPRAEASVTLHGSLYFTARSPEAGCQLWATDGTSQGTYLVKPLLGGKDCSEPSLALASLNGNVLFRGGDGPGQVGLWRTDGTASGTVFVAPGLISNPLGVVGGSLLGWMGSGILRTDGTAGGTHAIPFAGLSFLEGRAVATPTRVYFRVYQPSRGGAELWVSDGTQEGTHIVLDVVSGSGGSDPTPMAAQEEVVYFAATDLTHGRELWRSGGDQASTRLVSDVNPNTCDSLPMGLTSAGDFVYFWTLGGVLWRSAGTAETTIQLRTLVRANIPQLLGEPGGVFFAGVDDDHGSELWHSNGTPDGTRMVVDLSPGPVGSGPQYLARAGGRMFFAANDGTHGSELWTTDGSAAGTIMVADLWPGEPPSTPENITAVDSKVFFVADDGGGKALWRSDGTSGGTVRVIGPESGFRVETGIYNRFTTAGGLLYFAASDGVHGEELWRSDGTLSGTRMVKDIHSYSEDVTGMGVVMGIKGVGRRVVFIADQAAGDLEPWISDGTDAGTSMLKDIYPGPEGSYPALVSEFFEIWDGSFCFSAFDPDYWRELWCSDGTAAGTRMLVDHLPYPFNMRLWDLAVAGRRFVYSFTPQDSFCDRCPYEAQLWMSDGTPAGTRQFRSPAPMDFRIRPYRMATHNDCVYFPGRDDRHGIELWRICPGQIREPRSRLYSAPGQ